MQTLVPDGIAGDEHAARVLARPETEQYAQTRRRQQPSETLGPFDQGDAGGECLLNPEFPGFFGIGNAVEVEVPDRRAVWCGRLVDLDQRKGRTRHLLVAGATSADEGPGEGGFSATEIAAQGKNVPRARQRREARCQRRRLRFVRERKFGFEPTRRDT